MYVVIVLALDQPKYVAAVQMDVYMSTPWIMEICFPCPAGKLMTLRPG